MTINQYYCRETSNSDSRETDSEFTVVHSHNVMQGFETVDLISFHVAYTVGIFSGRECASVFLIFVRNTH